MDANLNKKFEYGKCYQHEHFQKKHLHEKYITLLLLQKYKKQSTYANISIFKCGYFSIFNYKIVLFAQKFITLPIEKCITI